MLASSTSLTVAEAESGLRLDRVLTRHLKGMTRVSIRALLDAGRVYVNDRPGRAPAQTLTGGDIVRIAAADAIGDPRPYILFEDRSLAVAFKPAGAGLPPDLLAGHAPPRRGRRPSTPRAALALGRTASGVVPLARGSGPLLRLREQFEAGRARCSFVALVDGNLAGAAGELPGGWTWKRRRRFADAVLLSLTAPPSSRPRPLAALAAAGLRVRPLVSGDRGRLALHLDSVSFAHPATGRALRFTVPPPPSWKAAVAGCHEPRVLTAPVAAPSRAGAAAPERALRSPRLVLRDRVARRPA